MVGIDQASEAPKCRMVWCVRFSSMVKVWAALVSMVTVSSAVMMFLFMSKSLQLCVMIIAAKVRKIGQTAKQFSCFLMALATGKVGECSFRHLFYKKHYPLKRFGQNVWLFRAFSVILQR
jgi:hypothetical protein